MLVPHNLNFILNKSRLSNNLCKILNSNNKNLKHPKKKYNLKLNSSFIKAKDNNFINKINNNNNKTICNSSNYKCSKEKGK